MHFDERDCRSGERVANCNAGVGVRGGVKNDEVYLLAPRFLDLVDQRTLVIALEALSGGSGGLGGIDKPPVYFFERFSAVDFWLALPQKIQVRPVQDPNRANLGSCFYQSFPANPSILPYFASTIFRLASAANHPGQLSLHSRTSECPKISKNNTPALIDDHSERQSAARIP
jgi:hypothetical protein